MFDRSYKILYNEIMKARKYDTIRVWLYRKKAKEKDEKSAAVCLIVTVLFSGALKSYCEKNEIEESFEQTIKAYDKHIKDSLKNCKKDINVHNCKEVLEVIKDKYLWEKKKIIILKMFFILWL